MRRRETTTVAAVLAAALLITLGVARVAGAGTATSATASSKGLAEIPLVTCKTRQQVYSRHPLRRISRSVRRVSTFAGPLMFLGTKYWADARRRLLRPDPGELKTAKTPIYLKRETSVTVSVLPPDGHVAEVAVGLDQAPYEVSAPSVKLRSCRRGARVDGHRIGKWTMFPAGFKLDGPMCLPVTVQVEGEAKLIERQLAFGRGTCDAT
jgi:hypothetical protein